MSIVGWGRLLNTIRLLKNYEESGYLEHFCNTHGLDYRFYKRFLKANLAIISDQSELLQAIKDDKELAKRLNDILGPIES